MLLAYLGIPGPLAAAVGVSQILPAGEFLDARIEMLHALDAAAEILERTRKAAG